jgi:hypothetical protein
MAEAGDAAVDAVRVAARAMRLSRQPHGLGVEHRLGHLDEDHVGDRERG